MKVKELLQGLLLLTHNRPALENAEIISGPLAHPDCVVAWVIVDTVTKYRSTHVRFAESLDQLIDDIITNYDITEETITHCVVPIAGFTMQDLCEKLI